MKISSNIQENIAYFHQLLDVEKNFDVVYHSLEIGGRQACLYFVDGFTKDAAPSDADLRHGKTAGHARKCP